MTKKQLYKIADRVAQLEQIYSNPESSAEEIEKAAKEINTLANMMFALPNGMDLMMEVDSIIHKKLDKKKN